MAVTVNTQPRILFDTIAERDDALSYLPDGVECFCFENEKAFIKDAGAWLPYAHTIQVGGVPVTHRGNLNFTGQNVSIVDTPSSNTTEGNIGMGSHLDMTDIGSNNHASIDAHIADVESEHVTNGNAHNHDR